METIGALSFIGLIGWTVLCVVMGIKRDDGWFIGLAVSLLWFVLSMMLPFNATIDVVTPRTVEKTSTLLVASDDKYGIVMSENVSLYNAPTNEIRIIHTKRSNVYGLETSKETKIGTVKQGIVK